MSPGTVPFLGVNDSVDAEYPDEINARGRRYVQDDEERSFKTALSVLPHAGEGDLWADNEFVAPGDDGSVDVNLDAIRNVHGLDIADIEQRTGMSLEEMVQQADPEPLIGVDTHKDIIDRRRLALRTLGFDVKFRWQIASSRYSPGNMREFFKRKIAACQKHGAENAFGWIRHYFVLLTRFLHLLRSEQQFHSQEVICRMIVKSPANAFTLDCLELK